MVSSDELHFCEWPVYVIKQLNLKLFPSYIPNIDPETLQDDVILRLVHFLKISQDTSDFLKSARHFSELFPRQQAQGITIDVHQQSSWKLWHDLTSRVKLPIRIRLGTNVRKEQFDTITIIYIDMRIYICLFLFRWSSTVVVPLNCQVGLYQRDQEPPKNSPASHLRWAPSLTGVHQLNGSLRQEGCQPRWVLWLHHTVHLSHLGTSQISNPQRNQAIWRPASAKYLRPHPWICDFWHKVVAQR